MSSAIDRLVVALDADTPQPDITFSDLAAALAVVALSGYGFTDAHAGWLLFESVRGKTVHAKEWTDCTVPICAKRRAALAALEDPKP